MLTLHLQFEFVEENKEASVMEAFRILRKYEDAWYESGFEYVQLPSITPSQAEDILKKLKAVGESSGRNGIKKIKYKLIKNMDSKAKTFVENVVFDEGEYHFT